MDIIRVNSFVANHDILADLIWVQTVLQRLSADNKVATSTESVNE